MCMSLRGGTYYGASIHITIGLLFLGGFFVDLLGIAEIWHNVRNMCDDQVIWSVVNIFSFVLAFLAPMTLINPYATYFSLIMALIYILLFICFGLLVFRGTEKESVRMLKGSIAGFVVLQISAFFVYLIIWAVTNSVRNTRRAEALENLSKPTVMPSDLTHIEAILNEASVELKKNQSSVIHEIVLLQQSTPSPELNLEELLNEQPIISVYQVLIILFGALATLAYTSVVVMYVRDIDDNRIRSRP